MRSHFNTIACALSAVACCGMPLRAQKPVVGSKDLESLFTSKDPKLNANKQVADLMEAGQWDLAPMYLSPRYLQHNPNVASGLKPVLAYFAGRPSKPIADKNHWTTQVVSGWHSGDLINVQFSMFNCHRDAKDTHSSSRMRIEH
jgi:predicted SnoaL-like aldol condensation-catalyzing enzyme